MRGIRDLRREKALRERADRNTFGTFDRDVSAISGFCDKAAGRRGHPENPHANVAKCATLEWGTLRAHYCFTALVIVFRSEECPVQASLERGCGWRGSGIPCPASSARLYVGIQTHGDNPPPGSDGGRNELGARPYVSIAERENRFLHSAVACAPAPVGMTKQGRGVVCASVGMTMVGSIFILKKPGADGELGVVKDSGVREPGWPILSRSLRKGWAKHTVDPLGFRLSHCTPNLHLAALGHRLKASPGPLPETHSYGSCSTPIVPAPAQAPASPDCDACTATSPHACARSRH